MKKQKELTRRDFLQKMVVTTGIASLPLPLYFGCSTGRSNSQASLTFGVMADVHADLIPDKNDRIEKFIDEAIAKEVDFIIQLGDFCFPKKENLDFLGIWQQFKGSKYHLLGNHDMDVSSKKVMMDFLEMPSNYYSFDQKGIHFVVLDPNYLFTENKYKDYDNSNFYVNDNFRTYINPAQIEWLTADLKQTNLPTIIFSHQSLINPIWGIKNRVQIQTLLEKENQRAGFQKIIACFNGHDHIDFHRTLNNIHYIEINSMSYQWIGEKYSNKTRYPANLYEKYGHLDKLAPYQDSLYAFIAIDKTNGTLKIDGLQSEWVAPSPKDLKIPEQVYGAKYSPNISNRALVFR